MLFITLTKPSERKEFAAINNAVKEVGTVLPVAVSNSANQKTPDALVNALVRFYLTKFERNNEAAIALYVEKTTKDAITTLIVGIRKTDETEEPRVKTFITHDLSKKNQIGWMTNALITVLQRERLFEKKEISKTPA